MSKIEKFYVSESRDSERKFYNEVSRYEDEDFAALLSKSFEDVAMREGSTIEGTINSINENFVLVNIGFKSEGKIAIQQFANHSVLHVGNKIPVYIENTETSDGSILLSYVKALKQEAWQQLYDAYSSGDTQEVEGKILYSIRSGCIVDIDGLNAFLPTSHIDAKASQNPNSLIGINLKFHILKMEEKSGKIFVSRKKVLSAIYEEAKNNYIRNLNIGDIIQGKVKSITSYGVFVQIHESDETGEVYGLLYIDDISWARVAHPSSIFNIGQDITVKIIGTDVDKKKISLGVKQLTENPWKNISSKYSMGKIYPGVVTAIEDYGMFVSLEKGVEGLVHNMEVSWTRERPLFLPGQKVNVTLLSIDEDRHKIALSIRQCTDNPWQKFLEHYPLGSVMTCIILEITDSGIVVTLQDPAFNYVKTLIKLYNITWKNNPKKELKELTVGAEVKAKLIHVNTKKGKAMLSLKHAEFDPFEDFLNTVREGESITAKILRIEDDGIYVEAREKLEFFTPQDNVSGLTVGQELSFKVEHKEKYRLRLLPQRDQQD